MKLKTADTPGAAAPTQPTGSAIIADRFKLDVPDAPAKSAGGTSKLAAALALTAALVSAALLGAAAALMYVNWGAIADA